MKKILIVVDMQNDFIDGSLGSEEAVEIVDKVVDNFVVPWEVGSFVAGKVVVPRDTAFAVEQVVDRLALDESFDSL